MLPHFPELILPRMPLTCLLTNDPICPLYPLGLFFSNMMLRVLKPRHCFRCKKAFSTKCLNSYKYSSYSRYYTEIPLRWNYRNGFMLPHLVQNLIPIISPVSQTMGCSDPIHQRASLLAISTGTLNIMTLTGIPCAPTSPWISGDPPFVRLIS